MTYEELLENIKSKNYRESRTLDTPYIALRAVVEILNDYNDGQVRANEEFNQGILSLSNVIKAAIEKELV